MFFAVFSLCIAVCTDFSYSYSYYTDVLKYGFWGCFLVSQLVGYGVRMSKHLGLALGSPSLGSTILLNLFHLCETKAQIEQQPPMSNQRVLSSTVEVLNCTHLTLSWCTPSQSDNTTTQLSPPRPEVIRTTSSSTKLGTRTVDSPLQDRSSEQTKEISSSKAPSHSPARSKKGRSSSPGPLIQENAKRGRTDLGSIAAVWSILEKETTKGKALLQTFASRWLSGRFLLPGNLVTLPICGCDCVFVVTHAHSSSISKGGDLNVTDSDSVKDAKPNLNINDLLPPPHLSVYKVGHMTNITLLAPSQTNKEIPENQFDSKKVEVQSLETGDIAAAKVSPVLEERVKYSALGGLSDQIRTIKQLVDLSLLHSHLFMRYITFLDYMASTVGAFLSFTAALCLDSLIKFDACVIDEAGMVCRHHGGYYCLDRLEQARAH